MIRLISSGVDKRECREAPQVHVHNFTCDTAKQLTRNQWEWDKHPGLSADAQQTVFYSNRTGKRQRYMMESDGFGEDWDPVWVKR